MGTQRGATFRSLVAETKVAVDPKFAFDVEETRRKEAGSELHEMPSDEFFGRIVCPGDEFDVIFLDGLHTFEQTLRDFNNALRILSSGGTIVIDDVTPNSHISAIPDEERVRLLRSMLGDEDRAWMGDVFRLVFLIDSFHQELSFRTVEETGSQLVVWRQWREGVAPRSLAQIAAMTFDEMLFQRDSFRLSPLSSIIDEILAAGEPRSRSQPS